MYPGKWKRYCKPPVVRENHTFRDKERRENNQNRKEIWHAHFGFIQRRESGDVLKT